jgi:hypothetical protein
VYARVLQLDGNIHTCLHIQSLLTHSLTTHPSTHHPSIHSPIHTLTIYTFSPIHTLQAIYLHFTHSYISTYSCYTLTHSYTHLFIHFTHLYISTHSYTSPIHTSHSTSYTSTIPCIHFTHTYIAPIYTLTLLHITSLTCILKAASVSAINCYSLKCGRADFDFQDGCFVSISQIKITRSPSRINKINHTRHDRGCGHGLNRQSQQHLKPPQQPRRGNSIRQQHLICLRLASPVAHQLTRSVAQAARRDLRRR